MAEGKGRIIIPADAEVWPHESRCAKTLATLGYTVEFMRRTEGDGVKSADIQMNGAVWEIKSPETSNVKALQRVLRRAGRQSPNVIIDTVRATKLSDDAILREIRRLAPLTKSVKRILVVTKSGSVVDIG